MEPDELLDSEELETTEETVTEDTGEDTQEESTEESQDEVLTPEQIAELKAKAARADELEKKNKQLFERAKKNTPASKEAKDNLSSKDLYALMEAKVPRDDIDEVTRAAKALNLSIPEALKSNIVIGILSERAEERRTATATQTRGGARGSVKVSGADILAKAERTGELPDTDEGMAALAQARMAKRLGITK